MKKHILFGLLLVATAAAAVACAVPAEESRTQESMSAVSEPESRAETESGIEESEPEESEERTQTVTVESGELTAAVFEKLTAAGYASEASEWMDLEAAVNADGYRWLSQVTNREERCFFTEGYIMPGEYEIPEEATPAQVLDQLLRGWEERLPQELQNRLEESPFSMDEVLTMASIVEWESAYGTDPTIKPNIAAVIRNRLQQGMPLQMDTSWFYLQALREIGLKDPAPYEEAYDTYTCPALPPGPICNPGLDAVRAVLEAPETKNLFFVWKVETGEYFFAETYEGHLKNIEKAGIE